MFSVRGTSKAKVWRVEKEADIFRKVNFILFLLWEIFSSFIDIIDKEVNSQCG